MKKTTHPKPTREQRRQRAREVRAQAKQDVRSHPLLFTTYVVLRALVLLVLVLEALKGDYYNVFLCGLTLVLFMIPAFVEHRLHIDVPNTLEIIILLFIFSAEILGEIQEYYLMFPFWDTMLHTMNGFLMAAIGIAMVDILNRSRKFKVRLSPAFVALVAFCFSMTVGVVWEFFEYGMDVFFHTDMQKDTWINTIYSVSLNPEGRNVAQQVIVDSVVVNGEAWPGYLDIGLHDTMKDLLVNFVGAVIFSVIGALYIMGRGKGWFAKKFIPRLKVDELPPPSEEPGLLEPLPLGEERARGPPTHPASTAPSAALRRGRRPVTEFTRTSTPWPFWTPPGTWRATPWSSPRSMWRPSTTARRRSPCNWRALCGWSLSTM